MVKAAKTVELSQPINEFWNLGAIGEPHLHLHSKTPAKSSLEPIPSEPLSITIDRRYLVRGDRIDADRY